MLEYVLPRNPISVQGVKERLEKLATTRRRMREHWETAVAAQQKYYNRRHQPMEFSVRQIVGLSTGKFKFKNGRKLARTYIRVKVLERIGKLAYRVTLPTQYARVHDVSPVSSLEPWNDGRSEADSYRCLSLVDEQEEWEVEEVVAHQGEGSGCGI